MSAQTKPATPEAEEHWEYLEPRPGKWSKQLFLKGHRLKAFDVWYFLNGANPNSIEEVERNWELSPAEIEECVRYTESHWDLIHAEMQAEKEMLIAEGIPFEPPAPARRR